MYAGIAQSIRFISLLIFLVSPVVSLAQDQRGEAKKSSEESMKKVDDGKPILTNNMMNHMMQAQMYRAQKNYAKAAEEDMKAQLLREQLRENQESRDKNEKRRDIATYSSDAAQSQLKGAVQSSAMNGNYTYAPQAIEASPTLSGLFGPVGPTPSDAARSLERSPTGLPTAAEEEINSELIIFDETVAGAANKPTGEAMPEPVSAVNTAAEVAEANDGVSADSIAAFQGELSRAENQMVALNAADVASQMPVRVDSPSKKKKSGEDDEEFWKTAPKKIEKKEKSRRLGRARVQAQPTN